MRNIAEMEKTLEDFDDDDYDIVKALIPWVFTESYEEYNRSFNLGDSEREGLKFLIGERIYWFLIDIAGWSDVDLDLIMDIVYEYYEK